MLDTPDVIVGKRNVLAFGLLFTIAICPILNALTGWPELEGAQKWAVWAVTPLIWLFTVGAFVSRIRLDKSGIETWTPLLGERRIAWTDVVAVSTRPLVVGTVTTVLGRNGMTIPLTAIHANRDEMVAVVRERSRAVAS